MDARYTLDPELKEESVNAPSLNILYQYKARSRCKARKRNSGRLSSRQIHRLIPTRLHRIHVMNAQDLNQFKNTLEQLRDELRASTDIAIEGSRPMQLDQASVGRLSRMDAIQGQAMAIETRRRRELQRKRVDSALERIACGAYGVCRSCEQDIDPRRLSIDPTATHCITCANASDNSR